MIELSSATPQEAGAAVGNLFPDISCRRVCACVDRSALGRKVVRHAAALARTLGAELVLLHVLESGPEGARSSDPVEWAARREEARMMLERLSRDCAGPVRSVRLQVLEGRAAEQICLWGWTNEVDVTVACTHRTVSSRECDLGSTVRAVLECASGSLLLVPATVPDEPVTGYKRLVVPLDGSSRAESALPIAIRLSTSASGSIRLVHAVPEPALTMTGPLDPEDLELRERIVSRNERVARDYLNRIRERLAGRVANVRTQLLRNGDVRHALCRAIDRHVADLIVLASHGHGGHADVATGSVAGHLLARAASPLLLVRHPTQDRERASSYQRRAHLPERASA